MALTLGPSDLFAVCLFLVAGVYAVGTRWRLKDVPPDSVKSTPAQGSSTNNKDREPGEWTPVPFEYPQIEPCKADLSSVKPIPYRPFRWGEYFVTMGIRSMQWNDWIELDDQFMDYFKIREHRIRTRGDRLVRTLPATPGVVGGGHEAAVELVHELSEYLSRKYPATYTVTRHASAEKTKYGWYGENPIKEITIVPVQRTFKLDEEDPMRLAALLIQEDLAIMIEGSDGQYYLQAGAIVIPGTWRLVDKIGMPLDEIHTSGDVPQFESKLKLSMNRYFTRLQVDKPVERHNYTFQTIDPAAQASEAPLSTDPDLETEALLDPTELAWSRSMSGNESVSHYSKPEFEENDQPEDRTETEAEKRSRLERVDPQNAILRVERQTLRRLPKTGAIVFTIRVYQTRVGDLVKERGVPGRMASAVRGWPEDVARYKNRALYRSMLHYLDACHKEQIERGDQEEGDRGSKYPF